MSSAYPTSSVLDSTPLTPSPLHLTMAIPGVNLKLQATVEPSFNEPLFYNEVSQSSVQQTIFLNPVIVNNGKKP